MERELLHRFYAGTATPEEEREVCRWVDASDEHRRMFMQERKLFDLLLLNDPAETESGRIGHSARVVNLLLKVAASVVLLITSALLTYRYLLPPVEKEVHAVVTGLNKITVPAGQRVNVTLSDGTSVWLNACSELVYPTSFDEDRRQVSLTGEACFEVSKDSIRPFVVQTAACYVRVLGTRFNVQADGRNGFTAALFEGSVELREKDGAKRSLRLLPMQKAMLTRSGLSVDTLLSLDEYQWKDGLVCADNLRFDELKLRFERIYGIRIEVRNAALASHRYSGKFRTTDGIDFILRVLQRGMPFRFTRSVDENTIIIQ